MSGRVLDFANYLGGASNSQVIEVLPQQQKTFQYDFNANVSNYTFDANYSHLVVDSLTYNINTGEPNFSSSNVVGYLGNVSYDIDANTYINVQDATSGIVNFTIPQNLYDGWIYPDTRSNVVITVVEFGWDDGGSPAAIDTHRWVLMQRYTADVVAGNPRDAGNTNKPFTSITGA